MSTKRHATVVYGYNLPCDFKEVERIDPEYSDKTACGLDVHADGMNGEYFLVGKTLVDYAIDSYDDDTEANSTPVLLSISFMEKAEVKKKLVALFPNHTGLLGPYYVTRYV